MGDIGVFWMDAMIIHVTREADHSTCGCVEEHFEIPLSVSSSVPQHSYPSQSFEMGGFFSYFDSYCRWGVF